MVQSFVGNHMTHGDIMRVKDGPRQEMHIGHW